MKIERMIVTQRLIEECLRFNLNLAKQRAVLPVRNPFEFAGLKERTTRVRGRQQPGWSCNNVGGVVGRLTCRVNGLRAAPRLS